MMPSSHAHLSDEQFMDCVMLAPSAAAEAHLAVCEHCRSELATFEQSMQDFGRVTAAWSEAAPKQSLRQAAVQQQRRTLGIRSAWAFAAVLLVAVSVPLLEQHRDAPSEHAALTASSGDSTTQIAADNQLMRNVYAALTPSDASPLEEYGLRDGSDAAGRSRSKVRVQ